jgi:4-hydroxy-tetrahydrodipicolinate synthase
MRIEGVIVPLLTPLTPAETVDEDGLTRLIEHVIAGGVSAVFLLGSTGEAPTLSAEQKTRLVRKAAARIAGRVPLLVGVIEAGTAQAIELAQAYVKAGAAALVPTAPFYFRYSQSELAGHFRAIAASVSVPVFLYNIPPLVKMSLSAALVEDLAHMPNILGIKDSEGRLDLFQQYLAVRGAIPGFQVWQGAEADAAVSVVRGADGVVLGLANIAPRLTTDLYRAAAQTDLPAAWRLQEKLMQLFTIQRHKSFLAGLKAAAHLLDLCGGTLTRPFEPLDAQQAQQVSQILAALELLPAEAGRHENASGAQYATSFPTVRSAR